MQQFTCAHGHRWEVPVDGPGHNGDGRRCPVCGESHMTIVLPGRSGVPTSAEPTPLEHAPCLPVVVPGCETLGELGRGGMGVVYKARQVATNRLVAVKMILAGAYAGAAQRDRFRIEARAAARLHHPNIVQLHEVGEHDGRPYCLLEYVPGRSLAHHLDGTPWPARQAAELIATLARAIHEAHVLGIVHRDLKPGNVLLAEDGTPKITDFGLAKILDSESGPTQSGDLLGTPSYVAPEQVERRGRPIGPAVDVYALGAILYELLTGRPPFRAETPLDTVLQVVGTEPVPVSRLQPKVPRDLETICMKCLEKEPRRRYGSAAALGDELGRFLHHQPIQARPVSLPARLARWCRRNPPLAVTSGLALGLLLATVVLSTYFAVQRGIVAEELQAALDAQHRSTTLGYLNQGVTACEQGEPATGILWFGRGLEKAPSTDTAFQHALRVNLRAWGNTLHPLRQVQATPGSIMQAVFSADSKTLVTTSGWGAALWKWQEEANRWHIVELLKEGAVQFVALSLDGSTAATVRDSRIMELWDGATGQRRRTPLTAETAVTVLALGSRGRFLLSAEAEGTVRLWDTRSGKALAALPHAKAAAFALFSANEQRVVTADDEGMLLWDVGNRKLLARLPHGDAVTAAAFHPTDPTQIFTGTQGGAVRSWDVSNLVERWTVQHGQPVRTILPSADGAKLFSGGDDRTARAWDNATGQPLFGPLQHRGPVRALALSPDGQTLLTAGADQTARLWQVATGQPLGASLQHQAGVTGAKFTPDGQTVLTAAANGLLRAWTLAAPLQPRRVFEHTDPVQVAAFSPDGRWLLTGTTGNGARLWNMRTGEPHGKVQLAEQPIYAIAFSPDSRLAAFVSGDWRTHVWDLSAKSPRPLGDRAEYLHGLTFSADGRRVLTAAEKDLHSWDLTTGRPVALLAWPEDVQAVALSGDGRTFCLANPARMSQLWDTATGRPLGPKCVHTALPLLLAFNRDATLIAVGTDDRTARVWDPHRGVPAGPPLRHAGPLAALALSPDGQTVLTVSEQTRVRLFNAVLGVQLGPVLTLDEAGAAAFTADGEGFVTPGADPTLRLWPVPLPLEGDLKHVVLTIEVLTGMVLDAGGVLHELAPDGWQERRQRLNALGGSLLP